MKHLEEEFLGLLHEYDARLKRICRIYAADREQRRDLYQDILVQLWRSLPAFEGEASPGTWLYRVALNTALMWRRGQSTRLQPQFDATAVDMHPDHRPQPPDRAEREEQLERLYTAIGTLSDTDKSLVLLHLDDTSYREMAAILGSSENRVAVQLHRAKQRLARQFEEHDNAMA